MKYVLYQTNSPLVLLDVPWLSLKSLSPGLFQVWFRQVKVMF